MTALLALFVRSVREDSRSKTMLWARLAIAGAVLFAVINVSDRFSFGGAPGLRFFQSVVWMNFFVICVAGVSYFASAVTEEKEESTLGLLRMTDLSPFAILLGKGTSRLVGGALLLLVQLPFAMLAITLGGVRLDQVLGSYALLGAFLFFACNVGLLGSVLGKKSGQAGVIAAVLGWLYLRAPVLLSLLYPAASPTRGALGELHETFDVSRMLSTLLSNRGTLPEIGANLTTMLGGGLAAFLLARVLFERFCTDASAAAAPARRSAAKSGSPAQSKQARRAWKDAICWRDFYFMHGGWWAFALKSLIYLVLALWFLIGSSWNTRSTRGFDLWIFAPIFFLSFGVICFDSLLAASRIFRLERKNKTLSGLFVLPGSPHTLARGKWRGLLLSLAPGWMVVIPSGIMLIIPVLGDSSMEGLFWIVQGIAYVIAQIFLNHYLVALMSLRMKWGGFPTALGISWLLNAVALAGAVAMFQWGSLFVLIIATVLVTIPLARAFRRKLDSIAAED